MGGRAGERRRLQVEPEEGYSTLAPLTISNSLHHPQGPSPSSVNAQTASNHANSTKNKGISTVNSSLRG